MSIRSIVLLLLLMPSLGYSHVPGPGDEVLFQHCWNDQDGTKLDLFAGVRKYTAHIADKRLGVDEQFIADQLMCIFSPINSDELVCRSEDNSVVLSVFVTGDSVSTRQVNIALTALNGSLSEFPNNTFTMTTKKRCQRNGSKTAAEKGLNSLKNKLRRDLLDIHSLRTDLGLKLLMKFGEWHSIYSHETFKTLVIVNDEVTATMNFHKRIENYNKKYKDKSNDFHVREYKRLVREVVSHLDKIEEILVY